MSSNMSSTNKDYQSAYSNYQQAMQDYKDTANQYTGEAGYDKSLKQGAKGASITAGASQQQAQNAYRNAGLTKAQSANLAAGQGVKAYQNNFETQQQAAANQNANAVTAAGNRANQQAAATQMQQQEGQNKYDRSWGNTGNILGIAGSFLKPFSDERLKVSENISTEEPRKKTAREYSQDMDKYFNKKNYKDLIIKR